MARLAIVVIGLLCYPAIVAAEKTFPVNVINTPTVKAEQLSQWNVDVTGVVTVDNAPNNPIPVITNTYPREIYQLQTGLDNQTGAYVSVRLAKVPENRRLVIEDLGWRVRLRSPNPAAELSFRCSLLISDMTVFLPSISDPVPYRHENWTEYEITYQGFQQMRAYGGPGDVVSISCNRSDDNAGDTWGVLGSLIGYKIPLDSPSLSP
jgi:hypothetical protein